MEENQHEIYRNLHDAIETENVEETEKLVNLLTEQLGMTEEIEMPKDFVSQIKRKDEKNNMRTRKRIVKAAAAGLVAVCALGGTTYAATHWNFDKVHFTDSGFITGDVDEDIEIAMHNAAETEGTENNDTNTGLNVFTEDSSGEMVAKDSYVSYSNDAESQSEVLEDVDGTKDTNWVHKRTSLETNTEFICDEEGNTQREKCTYKSIDYTYDSMEKLRADKVFPDIFTNDLLKDFSLTDNQITYTESYPDDNETLICQNLTATYCSGKKQMDLFLSMDSMYKEFMDNDAAKASSCTIFSEQGKAVENQRYYTTKNNVEFALEDIASDGDTHTIAYLSGNGYTLTITFYHMSEQKINEALEQIDATLLLEP